MPAETSAQRWLSSWPDALAFAGGLAVAWWWGWSTTDLVWSLWLSSLVVGYATIVWTIVRPTLAIGRGLGDPAVWTDPLAPKIPHVAGAAVVGVVGGLMLLAFFTVHFGMFHYIHSKFLLTFFPIEGSGGASGTEGPWTYVEVVRRYWAFLPMAIVAERAGFANAAPVTKRIVTAIRDAGDLKAARRARVSGFSAPYANVVRLHLLIFFFAAVHLAGLESFVVYSVVYAVYFFPWRLVRRGDAAMTAETAGAT